MFRNSRLNRVDILKHLKLYMQSNWRGILTDTFSPKHQSIMNFRLHSFVSIIVPLGTPSIGNLMNQ